MCTISYVFLYREKKIKKRSFPDSPFPSMLIDRAQNSQRLPRPLPSPFEVLPWCPQIWISVMVFLTMTSFWIFFCTQNVGAFEYICFWSQNWMPLKKWNLRPAHQYQYYLIPVQRRALTTTTKPYKTQEEKNKKNFWEWNAITPYRLHIKSSSSC